MIDQILDNYGANGAFYGTIEKAQFRLVAIHKLLWVLRHGKFSLNDLGPSGSVLLFKAANVNAQGSRMASWQLWRCRFLVVSTSI